MYQLYVPGSLGIQGTAVEHVGQTGFLAHGSSKPLNHGTRGSSVRGHQTLVHSVPHVSELASLCCGGESGGKVRGW